MFSRKNENPINAKRAVFALPESLKLISRKIWVIEKSWNFYTVAFKVQSVEIREILLRIFRKNFVKVTGSGFSKWLIWWNNSFVSEREFIVFPHCEVVVGEVFSHANFTWNQSIFTLCLHSHLIRHCTVWKFHGFSITQIIREIIFGNSARCGAYSEALRMFALFEGWNLYNYQNSESLELQKVQF